MSYPENCLYIHVQLSKVEWCSLICGYRSVIKDTLLKEIQVFFPKSYYLHFSFWLGHLYTMSIWCKDVTTVKMIIDQNNNLVQRFASGNSQRNKGPGPLRTASCYCPVDISTYSSGARSWGHDLSPETVGQGVVFSQKLFFPSATSLQSQVAGDQKYQLGCIAVSLWFKVLSRSLSSRHSTVRGYVVSSNLLAKRLGELINHFKSPFP